jgi:hypothetical protein
VSCGVLIGDLVVKMRSVSAKRKKNKSGIIKSLDTRTPIEKRVRCIECKKEFQINIREGDNVLKKISDKDNSVCPICLDFNQRLKESKRKRKVNEIEKGQGFFDNFKKSFKKFLRYFYTMEEKEEEKVDEIWKSEVESPPKKIDNLYLGRGFVHNDRLATPLELEDIKKQHKETMKIKKLWEEGMKRPKYVKQKKKKK